MGGADFCNNSHDQRTLSISCRESTGIWIICSMRLLSFVIFSFLFANVFSKTYLVKTKEKAVKPKADENRQLAPKPDYNWGWSGGCCKSNKHGPNHQQHIGQPNVQLTLGQQQLTLGPQQLTLGPQQLTLGPQQVPLGPRQLPRDRGQLNLQDGTRRGRCADDLKF